MILYRSPNVHLFAFSPREHRAQRRQTVGVALHLRAPGRAWRVFSLSAYWPRNDLVKGRGVLSVEGTTWRTKGGIKGRLGVKAFVRLKIGLGGVPS